VPTHVQAVAPRGRSHELADRDITSHLFLTELKIVERRLKSNSSFKAGGGYGAIAATHQSVRHGWMMGRPPPPRTMMVLVLVTAMAVAMAMLLVIAPPHW